MEQAARELIRAIRGDLSQVAFARALGFRSNTLADWEGGRRFPTIARVIRAAERRRIDVAGAFARFAPRIADRYDPVDLAPWLDALRGTTTNRELARLSGFSEHQVSRLVRGVAEPRLPQFLRLVDAMTDRCSDWVAELVPIDAVPSLVVRHRARHRVRRLVFDRPWTPAVLARVGASRPAARDPDPVVAIARSLGAAPDDVAAVLSALIDAGVVARRDGRLEVTAKLTVDAHPGPDDLQSLRRHWADVSRARLDAPGAHDRFSYNVFNVTRADLERIRELQAGLYRQIRAIVAESAPEVTALWLGHLVAWGDEDPGHR